MLARQHPDSRPSIGRLLKEVRQFSDIALGIFWHALQLCIENYARTKEQQSSEYVGNKAVELFWEVLDSCMLVEHAVEHIIPAEVTSAPNQADRSSSSIDPFTEHILGNTTLSSLFKEKWKRQALRRDIKTLHLHKQLIDSVLHEGKINEVWVLLTELSLSFPTQHWQQIVAHYVFRLKEETKLNQSEVWCMTLQMELGSSLYARLLKQPRAENQSYGQAFSYMTEDFELEDEIATLHATLTHLGVSPDVIEKHCEAMRIVYPQNLARNDARLTFALEAHRTFEYQEKLGAHYIEVLQVLIKVLKLTGAPHTANMSLDSGVCAGASTLIGILKEMGYTDVSMGYIFRAITRLALDKKLSAQELEVLNVKVSTQVTSQGEITCVLTLDDHTRIEFSQQQLEGLVTDNEVNSHVSAYAGHPHIESVVAESIKHLLTNSKGIVLNGRNTATLFEGTYDLAVFLYTTVQATVERAIKRAEKKRGRSLTPEERAEEASVAIARNARDMAKGFLARPSYVVSGYHNERSMPGGHYDVAIDTTTVAPRVVAAEALAQMIIKLTSDNLLERPRNQRMVNDTARLCASFVLKHSVVMTTGTTATEPTLHRTDIKRWPLLYDMQKPYQSPIDW